MTGSDVAGERAAARSPAVWMAGLAAASLAGSALGLLEKRGCGALTRGGARALAARCYSDIYLLYYRDGLAAGRTPYTGHPVEYPVLTGWVMEAAAAVVRLLPAPARGWDFVTVTSLMLAGFAAAGVIATGQAAGQGRRWTAIGVALAPAVILTSFINWDLMAMSLAALGIAAWATRRQALAGVLLGLAVAAKFYPLLFFWPLLLLCLRAGRMRAFAVTAGTAAVTWLVLNLPVAIAAPAGWAEFYHLSEARPADPTSLWRYPDYLRLPVLGSTRLGTLNSLSLACFGIGAAAIAVLALTAKRRPRLPQLCLLTVAAFLLSSKVWSPQYVIWLAPLVVLALPRLLPFVIWQLTELAYYPFIWAYLTTASLTTPDHVPVIAGAPPSGYFVALLIRAAGVLILCALVVRDILRPAADPVRAGGADDPAGGVLAGASDQFRPRAWALPGGWADRAGWVRRAGWTGTRGS